jgi:hypothetical protein
MEKDDRQLLSKAIEDGLCWKPYSAWREKDKNMLATGTVRMNVAGVCVLSRRLMAIERARVLGRKPVDAHAMALELEARRWLGERVTRV